MIWIYLLIYGIAFGIVSSLAVKGKNRDQGAWFFAGLVFGVFGLLAALIVDKVENQTSMSQSPPAFDPSQFTKKCPDCAESIKLEARVCRFCQHKFTEEDVEREVNLRKDSFDQENKLPVSSVIYEFVCTSCGATETIPMERVFSTGLYKKFEARVKSRLGFQTLTLECLQCHFSFVPDLSSHKNLDSSATQTVGT